MPAISELCKIGNECLAGNDVFYPGGSFFIDPEGMTIMQLTFVFLVYGYVLFISADMIGNGAEMLLLVPGYADMVGSMVLPILGAIPDGMMVLFSGIGPIEIAQENVAVGVGALAGSTIMLLTLPWILSVYAGQVDMNASGECVGYKAKSGKRKTTDQTGCQFLEGVTKNAYLMFITSLSYFVIQIPAYMVDDQMLKKDYATEQDYINEIEKESTHENQWALAGIIATTFFFVFYLYLQFLAATNRTPPLAFLKGLLPPPRDAVDVDLVKQHGLLPLIDHYRSNYQSTGKIRDRPTGQDPMAYAEFLPGVGLPKDISESLKSLYKEYAAKTSDKKGLHKEDMRQVMTITGLNFKPDDFNDEFKKSDKDGSNTIDLQEFLTLFHDLITREKPLPYHQKEAAPSKDVEAGGDEEEDEEEDEMPEEFKDLDPAEQQKQITRAACKLMLTGTVLVLIFSDPMVDVLAQIGKMTGVPAFYVSFILAPLASNASELVSSMKLAARKSKTSITQSLQTLEGAACMNNTFCLGIFFVLIYIQGLAWKFTAETISIFFVQVVVFLLVIKSNTQTMSQGFVIFMCYPLSLVVVYVLENFMGLD